MGTPQISEQPRPGKRERNKAENREAILAAARRVFAELGYEAATIRDVIGATTLAAGTFYNYFPDKESVLRALLDEKMEEMQLRARAARRDARSIDEVVRETLRVSFAMLAEDRETFDLLHRNAGAIRAILDEPGFVANRDELRRDLERAMRRTGVTGIDSEYLTAAISGMAFEIAACAVDRRPHAMEAAAAFATALVLGGIAALRSDAGRPPTKRSSVSVVPRDRAALDAASGGATAPTTKKGKRP